MDLFSFQRKLDSERAKIKIPSDCTEREPFIEPTLPPLTWQVEWVFTFEDGSHIRIWEYYDKFAGLSIARRVQFSYHYGTGPVPTEDDEIDQNQSVYLRIDTCGGLHAHKGKREPHIGPDHIKGRELASINAIEFIKGVLKARRIRKPVEDVLGLKFE